jgi:DHA3 family macrolide efflux protein-like MFS transporter
MAYQPPPNGFRTFLITWFTQSVSVFGSALTVFSINIWLTTVLYARPDQKPELALALSLFNVSFALPVVFIGPLAGAWADRHDRKRTMMITDFISGGTSLALSFLIFTHTLQFWMLLVLGSAVAVLSAFHGSAFDASYSMIVPEHLLPRANGMMQTMWSLSGVIAPAIAAAIIASPGLARQGLVPGALGAVFGGMTDGTPLAILADAITFFLAAGALVFLDIPSPKRSDLTADGRPKQSMLSDVREGALYIWHRRPLLWLLGTFTVANLLGSPLPVFLPLIVKFNLAPDWMARGFTFEAALAVLATVSSVGGLSGGLLISAWGGLKKKRVYAIVLTLLINGVTLVAFGLSPFLYLSAAMLFIASANNPIMNSHSQAIWQTQTPRELQGRVFSVRRLIAQFTWPLGTLSAGLLGGLFNPGTVLAVLGAIMIIFCTAQLFNPYLLRVEDKAWLDEMAARRGLAG